MSIKMLAVAGLAAALAPGFAGAVSAKTEKLAATDVRLFQSDAGHSVSSGKELGKPALSVQKRVGGTTR